MQKLYVNLGRLGDAINLLPILWSDAQSGSRSGMLVSKEIAGLLDGCSYVDPFIFDGPPHDLEGAMRFAKTLNKQIICCQTAGPLDVIQKYSYGPAGLAHAAEESFQKTAWKMAGRLSDWKSQLPLVIDRRDEDRERQLVRDWSLRRKHILVHAQGKSSPFPFKDLLFTLLNLKFRKGWEVHDLSEMKAERFYDLLRPMEMATALVAIDSAPLHLAYACKSLPVIALVNDRPQLWNGSVWRPNHICHIRYTDFPRRCVEMLDAIDSIGSAGNWFCKETKTPKIVHVWSAYEVTDKNRERNVTAIDTWGREVQSGHWIQTPVEVGSLGRDSRNTLKDEKRFCYLRDAMRLACLRAGDSDLICLTRSDTCFREGLTEALLKHPLSYAHRTVEDGNRRTWHPMVDLFCMPKTWWQAHQHEMPDMVLGHDIFWPRVMTEIMKRHGAVDLPFTVYRKPSKKE